MISLTAKKRTVLRKKVKNLREKDIIPAVLYGPDIKSQPLEIDLKEFEKIYKEAGESSLISLETKGQKKKNLVLIQEVQRNPLTEKPIHIDFYQPRLGEEIEATVPLIFEGTAPAIKELGGTLIKNIPEIEVKALPQNLPKEIKINIAKIKTFEDYILISDLEIPKEVKIVRGPEEIVVSVSPPEKVEEELEKPIEEKVEEVEKIEEKKKEPKEEKKEPSSPKALESEKKEKAGK